MSKRKNNSSDVLIAILSFLLVISVVAFILKFTNGLNEDLKTFYLEHNGKQIVSSDSQMTFDVDSEQRFDCKYILNPENNTYNVKVVPNITEETDFNYTVSGELCTWSEVKDLTSCFSINKQSDYFVISFPADFSMLNVLSSLYLNSDVVILDDLSIDQYYFTLQISNYNETINYFIDFYINNIEDLTQCYDISFVVDGEIVKTERLMKGSLISPPDKPYKEGYSFNYWVDSNGNRLFALATAIASENMTYTADFYINTVEIDFSINGNSFVSPGIVFLSVLNQSETVKLFLQDGETYSGFEVEHILPGFGGGTATPYALNSYPFEVVVNGNIITLTLSSTPSFSTDYKLTILVSGSSSGGSTGDGGILL